MTSDFVEIDVLLATYNGSKYLQSFLDSLKSQRNVKINLIVSDDKSIDSTREVILKNAASFNSLELLEGPNQGPCRNFFHLLGYSHSNYIAFADQDDVWEEDHLVNSINRITLLNEIPALTFCDVQEFSGDYQNLNQWPNLKALPPFEAFFFQNYARGCTMVFNKKLQALFAQRGVPNNAVMHDWWLVLFAFINGAVIYENKSEVFYRLHQNNAVGVTRKNFRSRIMGLLREGFTPLKQIIEIEQTNLSAANMNLYSKLSQLASLYQSSYLKRIVKILKMNFRQGLLDNWKCKIILCMPKKILLKRLEIQKE